MTQTQYPITVTPRQYNDPAYEVDRILHNVTVGDIARLPDGTADRAMRAYLRIIANIHAPTAQADARYIELALMRHGIWAVTR